MTLFYTRARRLLSFGISSFSILFSKEEKIQKKNTREEIHLDPTGWL